LFEREHHRRVASVLGALDADLLATNACLFGGGTAIALRHGEYRESIDIDFLVSDLAGYRTLRQRMAGLDGIRAILRPGKVLEQARDVRADQYGVRTMLLVDGVQIKFEIVLEARITLEAPGPDDRIYGAATLTPLDMATSKLLANADRWRDDAAHSRDLIDLAMMVAPKKLLKLAIEKARTAYGDSVDSALAQAIQNLRDRPHRLDQCMQAMGMTTVPKALLWKRIKALAP
jgi:Nucleotidyl transferase AbiEii toxin, Type IV TA system